MRRKSHSNDFIKTLCDKRIEEPTLPMNAMNQKLSNKKSFTLPFEIKERKRAINKEFDKRFGKYFIPYIPEAVTVFEQQLKDFFFSPKSKFLNQFPNLKKTIIKQKKLDMEKLSKKINIGSLLYLNLRDHLVSNKSTLNDKIFTLSKNYSLVEDKDELSPKIYNAKKKTLNRFLNYKKFSAFLKNQCKSQENVNINNNMEINKTSSNKDKENCSSFLSIFKNLLNGNKDMVLKRNEKIKQSVSDNHPNSKRQSLTKFTYSSDYPNDENNYNPIYKKTYSTPFFIYKNNILDKKVQKEKKENTETLTNSNTSISNNNNYYPFKSNIINNICYKSFDNKNEITENISNETKSNILEIIPDYKSVLSNNQSKTINTIKTTGNKEFNKKIFQKKIMLKTSSNCNSAKNMFDINKIINTQNSKKFAKHISSKVQDLNSVTNKCNNDLIKLIYINHGFKIKQKNKTDSQKNFIINEILSDSKDAKKLILRQKKINNKKNIGKILQEAVEDAIGLGKRNKTLEKKIFIKNINHLPEELALYMVGNLFKTNKIKFSLDETINKRNIEKEIKSKNKTQKSRKKAKYNYLKIFRLRNDLSLEKETFYNIYNDMEYKKFMFDTGKNKNDFLKYKSSFYQRKCYSP